MEKKHLFIGIGSVLGVVSATFISLFVWKSVTIGKTRLEHFVTFESYGGTHIESQRVEDGKNATKPKEDPKRGEDTFLGWFTDFGKEYTFNESVTKDIILYAGWEVAPEPKTTHSFEFTSDDCSINGLKEFKCNITIGEKAQFEIVPDDKCLIPNDITIIKGENVTYQKDSSRGYIQITNMTSDVEIEAKAVPINYYTFSFTSETCTINGEHEYTKEGIQEGTTTTFTILPDAGHVLPETIDTPEGVTYKDGVITITNMSSDVTLSAVAPEKEIFYSINFNGAKCKAKGGDITTSSYSFQTTRSSKDSSDFVITLSPDAGCTLPNEIEILFDNVPGQTGDYIYDSANKKIAIIKKANVLIKVKAVDPTKTYTVTWLDYDGTVLKTEEVEDGGAPTKPDDPIRHPSNPFIDFAFTGWLPEVSEEVHSNQTYVATYQTLFYENLGAFMHINIAEGSEDFDFFYTATSSITVDWGDGAQESSELKTMHHRYETVGEYNIRILNPITSIDTRNNTLIEELYLGKDVTSIGEYAFDGCSNLQTVTFEEGSKLTSIGDCAFYSCSSLTSINIPSGVTSIEDFAFGDCSSLTKITIPSGVTEILYNAFENCSSLESVAFEDESCLRSIFDCAFKNCSSLTSITIPSETSAIFDNAFENCSSLESVTFANESELVLIAQYAFQGCSSLTSIDIPKEVTSIGNSAFQGCSNLKTVTFEEGSKLTSIGTSAFNGCPSLTSITIPSSVTSIGDFAFNGCSSLTSIDIPKGVTSIGSSTFCGCSNLKTVNFKVESQLTSIGENAFDGCSSLTSITIPSSVTSIGAVAFRGCSALTSITIPSGVTSIGNRAFSNCSSLTSITIPSSVTSIGSDAFFGCSSLTSITIPSGVTSIGYDAFYYCSKLQTVTFEGESQLTSIEESTFNGCSSLTSITIPSSVTEIGLYAFSMCFSLTSITIPSGVTSIGDGAFDNCWQLKIVDLTALNSVPTLGNYAFSNCSESLELHVKTNMLEAFKAAPGWSTYATNIVPDPVPSIN